MQSLIQYGLSLAPGVRSAGRRRVRTTPLVVRTLSAGRAVAAGAEEDAVGVSIGSGVGVPTGEGSAASALWTWGTTLAAGDRVGTRLSVSPKLAPKPITNPTTATITIGSNPRRRDPNLLGSAGRCGGASASNHVTCPGLARLSSFGESTLEDGANIGPIPGSVSIALERENADGKVGVNRAEVEPESRFCSDGWSSWIASQPRSIEEVRAELGGATSRSTRGAFVDGIRTSGERGAVR